MIAPLALSLSLCLSLASLTLAQDPSPAPAIGGSGPPPPALTTTAAEGSWRPPQPTDGLPAPSLTGSGLQAHINSANDFCLFMQKNPDKDNLVEAEQSAALYCINPKNGTRPMPDNFILSAHFRRTDNYVQVTGTFNRLVMNLGPNDCGGELDNHGAEGVGNPVGAEIDGAHDWFQFLGSCDIPGLSTFGIRACHGPQSYDYCKNTYDLMGSLFVMPGDYSPSGFNDCEATDSLIVGKYPDGSTFTQGMSMTPDASHYPPAPASSNCRNVASPANSGVTYYWDQSGGRKASVTGSFDASSPTGAANPGTGSSSANGNSNSNSNSGSANNSTASGTAPANAGTNVQSLPGLQNVGAVVAAALAIYAFVA